MSSLVDNLKAIYLTGKASIRFKKQTKKTKTDKMTLEEVFMVHI